MTGERAAIVIATLNRWLALELTLEALQRLEIPPGLQLTVRVVDNGSCDGSYQRLLAYARVEHRWPVEALQESAAGKSQALNRALDDLQADYVALIDDDIRVDPGWLRAALEHFRQCSCVGLRGPVRLSIPGPRPPWFTRRCEQLLGASGECETQPVVNLAGGNMVVRGPAVLKAGRFRSEMGPRAGSYRSGEDIEWSTRLSDLGLGLCFCSGVSCTHAYGPVYPSRWTLWQRQREYVRTELWWKWRTRGQRPPGSLGGELRGLLGALLRPQGKFEGFDYALELAQRVGRCQSRLAILRHG